MTGRKWDTMRHDENKQGGCQKRTVPAPEADAQAPAHLQRKHHGRNRKER